MRNSFKLCRIGKVNSVDESERTAKVEFENDLISDDLKVLITSKNNDYMPKVGDFVVCLFLPEGEGDGFVLGGF